MTIKHLLFLILCICLFAVKGSSQKHTFSADVFFKTDSATPSAVEYAKLEHMSRMADTVQIMSISVLAYCDDIGSTAYNEILSRKRAERVKKALTSLSVPEKMIDIKGKGEIALTNYKNIEQARANNRTAHVTITYIIKQKEQLTEKEKISASQVATTEKPEENREPNNEIPISDNQKVGDKITLENILFVGGRHILLPESYDALKKLKNTLLEKKKYHIMILGHICCVQSGNDGLDFDTGLYNLSVARAEVVYNYLVVNGVSADRLQYKGLKHDFPTGLSDQQDRRVEIEITKVVGE